MNECHLPAPKHYLLALVSREVVNVQTQLSLHERICIQASLAAITAARPLNAWRCLDVGRKLNLALLAHLQQF
jgi:hypothetical protein